MASQLRQDTLVGLPACISSRYAASWAEALEAINDNVAEWALPARFRARLLLAPIPSGADRNTELKQRLAQWEKGQLHHLIRRVAGQQAETERKEAPKAGGTVNEEAAGRRARARVEAGAIGKAIQSLVGGMAAASPEQRKAWAEELIPRTEDAATTHPTQPEEVDAAACSWGAGDIAQAKQEMLESVADSARANGKAPVLPWVRLAPMTAAGPSGERQEHMDAILHHAGASHRRRLKRALNDLTMKWATGTAGSAHRWLLNTLVIFLHKQKEAADKTFEDAEWLVLQEMTEQEAADLGQTPVKVRPIQMGEFLRKWVSRRLASLSAKDVTRVMLHARQLGVGISGGAEALATFHQLIFDAWKAGDLTGALARIKIDEKNCFGLLEWGAIRKAAREHLPRQWAVAAWKHRHQSGVEQPGVEQTPKDRGAEQGDVDGPCECAITIASVAAEARLRVHGQQAAGQLPWTRATEPVNGRKAPDAFQHRAQRTKWWKDKNPQQRRNGQQDGLIIPSPDHEIQPGGGLADFWYLDDGDVLCDPRLVSSYLKAFDEANGAAGATRNLEKTEVIYYASELTLKDPPADWNLSWVQQNAAVHSADNPSVTLGVCTGGKEAILDQVTQKAKVVQAMTERIAVCGDAQTEHVMYKQSLGVCRLNHILRVHGHALVTAKDALDPFTQVARGAQARLFPGLTEESFRQAALGPEVGGLGWRTPADTALPAHLGALTAAAPLVDHFALQAERAGLLPEGVIQDRLRKLAQEAARAFRNTLQPAEQTKAAAFLEKAAAAAEKSFTAAMAGKTPDGGRVRAEAIYDEEVGQGHAPPPSLIEEEARELGDADPARGLVASQALQRELSRLKDCTKLRMLEAVLRQQCNWAQLDRLKELRHPEVSHKWLWHLNPRTGSVLSQADYVINVQKRLGAEIIDDIIICYQCGDVVDMSLEHSETCAIGEATKGHYACVRALCDGLRLADAAVTTEPKGLASNMARPADILTTAAVPGRRAALDVCVSSPNAAAAGGDAAQSAFDRKMDKYKDILPELKEAGVVFRPMIWTADARPHPAATRTLKYAASIAVRKCHAQTKEADLVSRWKHEITVAVARRRAAMARAVLPQNTDIEDWLLVGNPREDIEDADDGRLATVEEDDNIPDDISVYSDSDGSSSEASYVSVFEDDPGGEEGDNPDMDQEEEPPAGNEDEAGDEDDEV